MTTRSIDVLADAGQAGERILTPEALAFVAELHRTFNPIRLELLAARVERQERIVAGELPDFLPETHAVRADPDWRAAPPPPDFRDSRVECNTPVDRKMVIIDLYYGTKMYNAICVDI